MYFIDFFGSFFFLSFFFICCLVLKNFPSRFPWQFSVYSIFLLDLILSPPLSLSFPQFFIHLVMDKNTVLIGNQKFYLFFLFAKHQIVIFIHQFLLCLSIFLFIIFILFNSVSLLLIFFVHFKSFSLLNILFLSLQNPLATYSLFFILIVFDFLQYFFFIRIFKKIL